MNASRNLKTESGKATWKKVEQAAKNAPQWVKDNAKELASKVAKEQTDIEQSNRTQQT